ncbi:hypothetical protein BLNAU_20952 [Blattamonas nauphoetae]|uniref:Uncharacterized protein n=1 Tax=Blattamonas nauphoetae TaxID=2049346 RepID=A0ABQ9WX78_9EUKA|nr:hypothetical protein BLNAU_20952 [Blattamonas nauphoetae]
MNWDGKPIESTSAKSSVYQSLVALIKDDHALDDASEKKAASLLDQIKSFESIESEVSLLELMLSSPKASLTDLVSSITVLISSASQVITTATMEMIKSLIIWCSPNVRLSLVKADLIPHIFASLNQQSFSLPDYEHIHTYLVSIIASSLRLATPIWIAQLEIKDHNEQQAVLEMVLKQVLIPSEKYICLLCVSRFSIIDGTQSEGFLSLLAKLLRICPYYEPTMDFVLHMPVILTIPSCLALFEDDYTIWDFLSSMFDACEEWNKHSENIHRTRTALLQSLRTEGFEDVSEQKLQHDRGEFHGRRIVVHSMGLSNLQGMNLLQRR